MFGSSALEFAIGMSFVYLMLSLAVTALQEGIASVLRRRARTLAAGVGNLLRSEQLVERIYKHPLIVSLHSHKRPPSYIPSRTFALALLDTLTPEGQAPTGDSVKAALEKEDDETRHAIRVLRVLATESGGDFERFKTNIEVWFNNGMERVSGWYKRYTQAILVSIAIPLTIAVNADSLVMGNAIWKDPTLRAALVAEAGKIQSQPPVQLALGIDRSGDFVPPPPPPEPPESVDAAAALAEGYIGRLRDVQLPIGWQKRADGTTETLAEALRAHLVGWLITILAISLGAPFWFDLLNKFMTIRGAGKAPEEKQKSPKEEQPPMGPGETPREARENEPKRTPEP